MNRSVPFLLLLLALPGLAQAQATHELTNVGTTFSPNVITMLPGDNIHLVLASPHTCTEVSQATWDANGNTSNGGFNFSAGEHTFSLTTPGTYYYVCIPHAGMGMKGQIIVQDNTGVQEDLHNGALQLSPNPARDAIRIPGLRQGQNVQVLDITGRQVLAATPAADGSIDISMLKPGNYRIAVIDAHGQRTFTTPLVIAR